MMYAFSLLLIGTIAGLAEATATHSDFGCTNPILLGHGAKNAVFACDDNPDEDAAAFVHSWLSDQLDLHQHAGSFHTDGHTGNILVYYLEEDATVSFEWNDFGKTTRHESHQFCHNLAKVSNYFQNSTDLVRDVTSRLPMLHCPDGNDCCGDNVKNCFKVKDETLKVHFLDLSEQLEQSGAVDTVWHRLGDRRMGSRVGTLEKTVREHANQISDLKEQSDKNANDIADLKEQSDKNAKDIANLKEEFSKLKEEFSKLKEEFSNLKEEVSNLKEEVSNLKKMVEECLHMNNPKKGKKFKFREFFSRKNGNDQDL